MGSHFRMDDEVSVPESASQMGPADVDVTILEEKPSEEFQPTEKEIWDYAEWLGMDPVADKDLLYLAAEGLKAPLSDGWKPCSSNGEIFYFNFHTGESSWDHPADEHYKKLVKEIKANRRDPSKIIKQHQVYRSNQAAVAARNGELPVPVQMQNRRCRLFTRCCRRRRHAD
mmetsp:Transcript_7027/g.17018  ORF Transcript_7027/g.17018 Transcript_7027/m.17018 type:complete len:171 (-) Transcript_7027:128-640(-)